jgi:hypothetical protein
MQFTGRHFTIRVSFSCFGGMLISHDLYCFFIALFVADLAPPQESAS